MAMNTHYLRSTHLATDLAVRGIIAGLPRDITRSVLGSLTSTPTRAHAKFSF